VESCKCSPEGERYILRLSFHTNTSACQINGSLQSPLAAEAEFGCGSATLCVPYLGSRVLLRNRRTPTGLGVRFHVRGVA